MPVANTGKKATIAGKAVLLLIFLISFATNLIAPIATTMAMYLKQLSGSSTTYPKIVPSIDVIRFLYGTDATYAAPNGESCPKTAPLEINTPHKKYMLCIKIFFPVELSLKSFNLPESSFLTAVIFTHPVILIRVISYP